MRAQIAISRQLDTLDLLCRRAYGDESRYVEAVLVANPGLSDHVVLPIGTRVVLPEIAAPSPPEPVRLWT